MLSDLVPLQFVAPLACLAAKARGSNLRVHYKHMREVAHLIQGMKLSKSKQYLQVRELRVSIAGFFDIRLRLTQKVNSVPWSTRVAKCRISFALFAYLGSIGLDIFDTTDLSSWHFTD